MFRICLLGALVATAATAQVPEPVARTGVAEMLGILDRLEPAAGWLATPPGLQQESWDFYRTEFRMAPEGNEADEARVGLGRLLFFDQRLSRDRTLSCASCHDPRHGFAEPRARSVGIDGQVVARNAPTVMNVGLQRGFFWDGRADTLEEQAAGPILNPAEMGMPDRDAVVARVRAESEYVALFGLAYGREPEFDDIARALAAFERTLVFVDAPFDAFRAGQKDAIPADAQQGFELFAEHCRSCHTVSLRAPSFSDGNFHNVGIGFADRDHRALGRVAFPKLFAAERGDGVDVGGLVGQYGELGRALITKQEYQVGAFRTAPLRNVALTAPYMHDGSLATLWDVVDHYNRGGTPNSWQDPQIKALRLSDAQVDQVVAFLFSLTDRRFAKENRLAYDAQRRRGPPSPVIR
ncbi:MAG TPA: cytochrome c peroxidase [Planctomycetota bacterium]|nr:cytochrome c peroxidase [Planctomycetota bacterium]